MGILFRRTQANEAKFVSGDDAKRMELLKFVYSLPELGHCLRLSSIVCQRKWGWGGRHHCDGLVKRPQERLGLFRVGGGRSRVELRVSAEYLSSQKEENQNSERIRICLWTFAERNSAFDISGSHSQASHRTSPAEREDRSWLGCPRLRLWSRRCFYAGCRVRRTNRLGGGN
jgi:hypothetical protein